MSHMCIKAELLILFSNCAIDNFTINDDIKASTRTSLRACSYPEPGIILAMRFAIAIVRAMLSVARENLILSRL